MSYSTYATSAPAQTTSTTMVMGVVACVGIAAVLIGYSAAVPTSALYAPTAVTMRTTPSVVADARMARPIAAMQAASYDTYAQTAEEIEYADAAYYPTQEPTAPTTAAAQWLFLGGLASSALAVVAAYGKPSRSISMMSTTGEISKLTPLRSNVLIKVAEAEEKTTGGLVLPDSSKQRPTSGVVTAIGDEVSEVKEGDCLIYSKFGVQTIEVSVGGAPHLILREGDVMGIMPRSPANAKDIPEMKPIGNAVLVKKTSKSKETKAGLLLTSDPESEDKHQVGTVVAVGGGPDINVAPGDSVMHSKYAGEKMFTPDGLEFTCIDASDLLGVM